MKVVGSGLVTLLTGTIMAGALGGSPALAQTPPKQEPMAAPAARAETEAIQVSDDAFKAMREVRATRVAIFNGLPDVAKLDVAAAMKDIGAAAKEAPKLALDVKKPMKEGDMYVPFDVQLAVADSFAPSPEKAKHISEANEHLKKGEKSKAMEVLKLAEIDIAYSAALMPIKMSQQHIDAASKLIDDGKYYEANLALKAVEDSVIVTTYGVDEVPGQKTTSDAGLKK